MIKQSLVGLLFMVAINTVAANNNLYQVELLVFQNTDKHTLKTENWSPQNNEYQTPSSAPVIIESETVKTLTTESWALRQKLHFPILMHISWQQPIVRSRESYAVKLPAHPSLSGVLSFNQSNYLELTAHLRLENFQIKEKLRMRLGELHYLDHPAFGALIEINRIEA